LPPEVSARAELPVWLRQVRAESTQIAIKIKEKQFDTERVLILVAYKMKRISSNQIGPVIASQMETVHPEGDFFVIVS
jgi:hypothetical protein